MSAQKPAQYILARLRDVQIALPKLAGRDQLTPSENALRSFKIGMALSPIVFSEQLSLAKDGS